MIISYIADIMAFDNRLSKKFNIVTPSFVYSNHLFKIYFDDNCCKTQEK